MTNFAAEAPAAPSIPRPLRLSSDEGGTFVIGLSGGGERVRCRPLRRRSKKRGLLGVVASCSLGYTAAAAGWGECPALERCRPVVFGARRYRLRSASRFFPLLGAKGPPAPEGESGGEGHRLGTQPSPAPAAFAFTCSGRAPRGGIGGVAVLDTRRCCPESPEIMGALERRR